MSNEHEFALALSLSFHPADRIYSGERKRSNALKHRKRNLEVLALEMQLRGQSRQIQNIIDGHLAEMPPEAQRTDEDRSWLWALHRMDLRCLNVGNMSFPSEGNDSENKSTKSATISLVFKNLDPDLQNFVNARVKESSQYADILSPLSWGLGQWDQNSEKKDIDSWRDFLTRTRDTHRMKTAVDLEWVLKYGRGIVAAVCVRDHLEDMASDDRQWCINTLIAEVGQDNESEDSAVNISINTISPDSHAAYVLPKILSRNQNDVEILKAVIRAVTHSSLEVSTRAADGVAKYLGHEHQNMVLSCIGAVVMHSNLLVQNEQLQAQRRMQGIFDEGHNTENTRKRVREECIQGSINVKQELADLNPISGHGWHATERILAMLGTAPDFVLTKDIVTKTGQAIVEAWSAIHEDHDTGVDSQPVLSAVDKLAGIVLTMTPDTALHCCKPFLNAVDEHPDKVDDFVMMLIIHEYRQNSDETCFWTLWQAFAYRIIDARWSCRISSSRSAGIKLIDKMLFGTHWRDGLRDWHSLADHRHQINAFMTNLPAVPPVLKSFTHYIYYSGGRTLPDDFIVVADRLQAGKSSRITQ